MLVVFVVFTKCPVELKTKTVDELIKDVRDARDEVSKMVIEMKTGKLKNVNFLKSKKKDIARILTVLHAKEGGKV